MLFYPTENGTKKKTIKRLSSFFTGKKMFKKKERCQTFWWYVLK